MPQQPDANPPAPADARLANALDDYLKRILPGWLRAASQARINRLRDELAALNAMHTALDAALARLQPLPRFASDLLQREVTAELVPGVAPEAMRWRETRRAFGRAPFQDPVVSLPIDQPYVVEAPALQRLMQNFTAAASFWEGTALVAAKDGQVLTDDIDTLVRRCRQADIGQRYQAHLEQVFDAPSVALLAREQRASLGVALQLQGMQQALLPADERFYQRLLQGRKLHHDQGVEVHSHGLTLIGCRISGALAFEVRGSWGAGTGPLPVNTLRALLLYLPGEPQPLQRFSNWNAASAALGLALRDPALRERLSARVALAERAAFVTTLAKRLGDSATDAQASGELLEGDPFEALARQHVERLKADARVLAVPTAAADHAASEARRASLEAAGLTLLNLAGLFIPVLGTLLLGKLVADTLGEVCEGAADWARGHQYEALEHLLGVAESVAVSAAVGLGASAVARGFARSALLERAEPVSDAAGQPRLHAVALQAYQVSQPPAPLLRQPNGLLHAQRRWWWQDRQATYEVQQVAEQWQLRHPWRAGGLHPVLRHNGERGWRLARQRPLEWQGAQLLLGYLWPEAAQLAAARVEQLLRVAGVDENQLRALVAHNVRLPVHLRDSLERFAASERIEGFFARVRSGRLAADDQSLLQHAVNQLDLGERAPAEQLQAIGMASGQLRGGLLAQLSGAGAADQPLVAMLQRDFPGLPQAYARRVLEQATGAQRQAMGDHGRVPLAVAEQARALLQVARLTRVREAFHVPGSYRDDAVEVAFDLLRRHARWPETVNLALRQGSASGPLLARLYPGPEAWVLVHQDGELHVYHADGQPAELPAGSLPEVLAACLPAAHRQRLGWVGADAAARIEAALQGWLPGSDQALMRALGMAPIKPWLNPLRRVAHGRLGYPMSGRGQASGAGQLLRERIRCLFPTFDDARVEAFLQDLLALPGSPYINLLVHERSYRELCASLAQWVGQDLALVGARARLARQLRRCWRREGEAVLAADGRPDGMRLSVVGLATRGLPELPSTVAFDHVTELTLVGLQLERLPGRFLRSFRQVRGLNLSNNQLRELPAELPHLQRLRTLYLQNNRVRMNASGLATLRRLAWLHVLDLSDNPLRVLDLNFTGLAQLRLLYLRRAELRALPAGIQWCGLLQLADLRNNAISSLPAFLQEAPLAFRQRLQLQGNPLAAAELARLALPGPVDVPGGAAGQGWLGWEEGLAVPAREQLQQSWVALRAEPGSDDFFNLLDALRGTSDFLRSRSDLQRRLQNMFAAMVEDTGLREELFQLAAAPRTCVDSVSHCFSALELRAVVYRTLQGAAPEASGPARLALARRLFRLECVEQQAQRFMQREAQAGRPVDEVEVSLALRIGLAPSLDLPGQPRSMRFAALANVSQADLDAAAQAVRRAEAGAGLALFISQREFWVEYLRLRHAARFDALEQPFWQRLEALDARRGEIDDGLYLSQAQQLGEERETALQALALQLTEAALAGHSSPADLLENPHEL